MARVFVIVAIALLLTGRAWAQSEANCEEIRQAVATYGYKEARRHAMSHYGVEAVEAGEKKCLAGMIPTKPAATKASVKKPAPARPPVKHAQPKKPKATAASIESPPRPPRDVGRPY